MQKRFEPIDQRSGEIIDYLMSYPDMPGTDADQFKVRLCIEEAVVNITNYAYKKGEDGWLDAYINFENGVLTIRLRDAGVQFNPLDKEDPDITLSAEDRDIGGLGIFLCKTMMDTISYNYVDGCNTLEMSMKIEN